jgi:hypothetical protein
LKSSDSTLQNNQEFDLLDQMIQRRHCIVHRADRVKEVDSENHVFQPILELEVRLWLTATTVFMSNLLRPLVMKLNPLEELAKKLNIKLVEESAE